MAVRFNEDQDMVKKIQEGLKRKGGYCPCKLPVIPENPPAEPPAPSTI